MVIAIQEVVEKENLGRTPISKSTLINAIHFVRKQIMKTAGECGSLIDSIKPMTALSTTNERMSSRYVSHLSPILNPSKVKDAVSCKPMKEDNAISCLLMVIAGGNPES